MADQPRHCPSCGKDFTNDNLTNQQRHELSCTRKRPAGTKLVTDFFESSKKKKLPSHGDLREAHTSDTVTPPPSTSVADLEDVEITSFQHQVTCAGLKTQLGSNFHNKYPYQVHTSGEFDFIPINGAVYSVRCFSRNMILPAGSKEQSCPDCLTLTCNTKLKQLLNRATVSAKDISHMNNSFLNHDQLVEKLEEKNAFITMTRLRSHTAQKHKIFLENQMSVYKKITKLLSENNIPRIKQLLAVCVRQNRSIGFIMEQITSAISGLYSPKGYSCEDFDIAGMILLAGGPRLLHILHRTSGLPSLSHTYNIISTEYNLHKTKLCALSLDNMDVQLSENVKLEKKSVGESKCVWSLKVDEIAVEKRLRWDDATNRIEGFCANHTLPTELIFNSMHSVSNLETKLENDVIHLASEACVFAFSQVSETNYHGRPILVLPICNHKTADLQHSIFNVFIKSWDLSHGPIINIATDGDGVRRSVLHAMITHKLDKSARLYSELSKLDRLDTMTAEGNITVNYDPKHIIKRVRNNILSGGVTIHDINLNASVLRLLLAKNELVEIESILNPVDKQNVPLAVKLVDKFTCSWETSNWTAGMVEMIPALASMKVICDGLLSFFAKPSMPIEEALVDISALAHTLLHLYRDNNKLMPNVLYHDIQSNVQDAFFCAAKFKMSYPEKPLYLYQLGSDQVEQLFSSVRTQTHDRACDILQLEQRLHRSSVMERIYAKHPDWRRKATRLSGPIDHSCPSQWTGNLKCGHLDLQSIWDSGRSLALSKLPKSVTTEIKDKEVTMMKPNGHVIGVTDKTQEVVNQDTPDDMAENSDAMIEFENNLQSDESTQSPTILVDGKSVFKATVLRLMSKNVGVCKSGDRLRRVQGLSKFPSFNSNSSATAISSEHFTVKDIATCLTQTSPKHPSKLYGLCLTLFVVDKLVDRDNKSRSFIDSSDTGVASGRVIILEEEEDRFVWKADKNGSTITCPIQACRVLSPEMNVNDGTVKFHFVREKLQEAFDSTEAPEKPTICDDGPYKDKNGLPIFFTPGESPPEDQGTVCKVCKKKLSKKSCRLHTGVHIIKGELADIVCGFCGQMGCSIDVKKTTHKTAIPVSNCVLYTKFSLKPAAVSKDSAPCTNRPVTCAECHVVYWSYHMPSHYENKHRGVVCDLKIEEAETQRMLKL